MNIDVNEIKVWTLSIIFTITLLIVCVFTIIGIRCCFTHMGSKSPVEENTHIDSLIKTNDSINSSESDNDSVGEGVKKIINKIKGIFDSSKKDKRRRCKKIRTRKRNG